MGTIVQYNYSQDNPKAFIRIQSSSTSKSSNTVIRYNISVRDGYGSVADGDEDGVISIYGPFDNEQIYNNLFITYADKPARTVVVGKFGTHICNVSLCNNIIVNFSNEGVFKDLNNDTNRIKVTFNNNLYYGSNSCRVDADANAVFGNPLFAGGEDIQAIVITGKSDDYKLKLTSNSPCINSGINVNNNGGRDYYGQILYYNLPDIGHCEYQGESGNVNISVEPEDPSYKDKVNLSVEVNNGKATVKAIATDPNYVFVAWKNEQGNYVSSNAIDTFNVTGSTTYKAVFKQLPSEYKVEVSAEGPGKIKAGDSAEFTDNKSEYYAKGSSLTITASPESGEFVCWEVNGVKINSTEPTYTINKIENNYKIKAYFKEAGKDKVIYKDPSGRILAVGDEPSGSALSKLGYVFKGWGQGSSSDIPGYKEMVAVYEPENKEYTVIVQKGSIIRGATPYTFDELIEVAPNGSGTFSYWTYNGEIVSYDSNYSFYASGDADITAVFNESVQAKPTAVISGVASSPEI